MRERVVDGGKNTIIKTLHKPKPNKLSRCGRKERRTGMRKRVDDGGRDNYEDIAPAKTKQTEQVWEEGEKSWYERESG